MFKERGGFRTQVVFLNAACVQERRPVVFLNAGNCVPFGTGKYCAQTVKVTPGVHNLISEQPVGVTVYAYDSFVSYGYPGGLDLNKMNLIKSPVVDEEPDSQ